MNLEKLLDTNSIDINQLYFYILAVIIRKSNWHLIYKSIKSIKYLGINLMKDVQGYYKENYKTFLWEIKEDLNRWQDSDVHGLEYSMLFKY